MIYYIADTHLRDQAIFDKCKRPFKSLSDMENAIINNWNKKVQDDVDVQLKQPITEDTLKNITQELNKLMSKINANLEFNYHKEAGMFSVALVDKETNEVIKELPPEEMVKNIVKGKIWMDAFIGTIVDTTA